MTVIVADDVLLSLWLFFFGTDSTQIMNNTFVQSNYFYGLNFHIARQSKNPNGIIVNHPNLCSSAGLKTEAFYFHFQSNMHFHSFPLINFILAF
jgi:hypothetical protein